MVRLETGLKQPEAIALYDAAGYRRLVEQRDEALGRLEALRESIARGRKWISDEGRESLDWGDFRRTDPTSRNWGYERGTPIDR